MMRGETVKLFEEGGWLDGEDASIDEWGGALSECDGEAVALPMLSIPLPTKKLVKKYPSKSLKELKTFLVMTLWNEFAIECPVSVWKDQVLHSRLSFPLHVDMSDVLRWKWAVEFVAGMHKGDEAVDWEEEEEDEDGSEGDEEENGSWFY